MSITITIENPLDATAAEIAAELDFLSAALKVAVNATGPQPDQPAPIVEALGIMDSARAAIARQRVTAEQSLALEMYARRYAARLEGQTKPAKFEQLITFTRALHRKAQETLDAAKASAYSLNSAETDAAKRLTDLQVPSEAINAIRDTVQTAHEQATAASA